MCFDFLPASQAYFGFVAIDLLNLQHMEPNPSPDSLSLWSVYMAFVGLFSTKYFKRRCTDVFITAYINRENRGS